MKKIQSLKGIKILNKLEQQEIKGAWKQHTYCKGNNQCCFRIPNGNEICDAGYCLSSGRCVWA